jgi:hypothetical protein
MSLTNFFYNRDNSFDKISIGGTAVTGAILYMSLMNLSYGDLQSFKLGMKLLLISAVLLLVHGVRKDVQAEAQINQAQPRLHQH